VVDSLEQIGSRRRLVVLHELLNGESRFNELKRETDANAPTLARARDPKRLTSSTADWRKTARRDVLFSLTPASVVAPVFEESTSGPRVARRVQRVGTELRMVDRL